MLEQYLASREAADADAELPTSVDAPIPTRAEDVDRFMAELVRATPATHHTCCQSLYSDLVCARSRFIIAQARAAGGGVMNSPEQRGGEP